MVDVYQPLGRLPLKEIAAEEGISSSYVTR
jgi:hypothetical protein